MKLEIKLTADGSPTLFSSELNEHYHSIHGAIQESNHVFIKAGLMHQRTISPHELNILEIGLGTGLNVLLTLREAQSGSLKMNYYALEPFPISMDLADQIKFPDVMDSQFQKHVYHLIHHSEFEENINLLPQFTLIKFRHQLEQFQTDHKFHLIYFDAFGPEVQPEIWSPEIFNKLFNWMHEHSTLVTYCAKGAVRRAMQDAGFIVERLPGPPGKREMLRARKLT